MTTVNLNDYSDLQTCLDHNNHVEQLTVIIPAGVHETGPINLRSNLVLHFEKDAILQFKDDPNLYEPVWTRWEGIECYGHASALICE